MAAQASRPEVSEQDAPIRPAAKPDPIDRGSRRMAPGFVDRICTCVIEGLMHCACAHHHAHPDLAACIQDAQARRYQTGRKGRSAAAEPDVPPLPPRSRKAADGRG